MAGEKFLVLDGNSLANRAFYGLPLLTNSQGVFTNAVYGFTNMLLKLLDDEKPHYIAVAFDKGRVTFRHTQYEQYKAQRKGMPEELRQQLPLIKKILTAMNIPIFEVDNYEADDLIGCLVKIAEQKGFNSLIITGDRDTFQLVSSHTKVLLTRKGISELEMFDLNKIWDKYGLTPAQIPDLKGLMGDASDNIPGVPGIGEKTALKLLHEYGSIEKVLDNISQIKGRKVADSLMTYRDQALISKQLATIVCDISIDLSIEDCRFQKPDYRRIAELFQELEFRSLSPWVMTQLAKEKDIEESSVAVSKNGQNFAVLNDYADIADLMQVIKKSGKAGVVVLADGHDPLRANLVGLAVSPFPGMARLLNLHDFPEPDRVLEPIKEMLEDSHVKKQFHDAKFALHLFRRKGIKVAGLDMDTMLAGYLLNPSLSSQTLPELWYQHFNVVLPEDDLLTPCIHAESVVKLSKVLKDKLADSELLQLFINLEFPLVEVLADMEWQGIKVDKTQLDIMAGVFAARLEELTSDIYRLAGTEFNINSTKQLGEILFDKLQLPVLKKTKTGFSTSAEVLEALADQHEIVRMILEYRQVMKLKSTYIDGLKGLINPDSGRLHTTFNQTVTATGRLSSTEPNLQNIPIRFELGRQIRKVFIPSRPDWVILAADYSQIELRVLAHIADDANLIEAFVKGQDIHSRTAAEVFGVEMSEVTGEMRRRAKAVNFGIVYGISDFGLAKDLGISRQEAKTYIENYFTKYPGVKNYLEQVIEDAKNRGYVTTLLKRRRYLPDLFSPNRNIRNFGERTAMNTPIQGSAADIIKLAMLRVSEKLREQGLKAKMLLQVHDELIFDVPIDEFTAVAEIVKTEMEAAYPLKVPLVVDIKYGPNWYELQPWLDKE